MVDEGFLFAEAVKKRGSVHEHFAWVDVSKSKKIGSLEVLKFCIMGKWKTFPF